MNNSSRSADAVSEALARWLQARFGGDVEPVGEPAANADGFDSAIYFVRFRGSELPSEWAEPLVVRVKPDVDGMAVARREAAVQGWLADRGYPAPRILEVFGPDELTSRPTQVMQRAPGSMLIDRVVAAPWTFRRQIDQLAALQVQLHQLHPTAFPTGNDLLDQRLRLTRSLVERLDDDDLRAGLARVEVIAARLRDGPTVICHGDFHPLNVIADGGALCVIDWSDAAIGDRHGDVARTLLLFELAAIAAKSPLQRAVFRVAGPLLRRTYRRSYDRRWALDDDRLALWMPVHLLHGWTQAVGVQAGAFGDDAGLGQRLGPELVDDLRRRFDAAIDAV